MEPQAPSPRDNSAQDTLVSPPQSPSSLPQSAPAQNEVQNQYSPTSSPIVSHPQTSHGHGSAGKNILLIIVFLLFGLSIAIAVISFNEVQKKNETINSLKATNTELSARIEALSNNDVKAKQQTNDQLRKSDLAKFAATVKEYKTQKNKWPSTEPTFFKKDFSDLYIKGKLTNFKDPNTGKDYEFTPVAPVQTPPGLTLGNIQFQWPAECAGSEFADLTDESKAATRILLESGETYCINI